MRELSLVDAITEIKLVNDEFGPSALFFMIGAGVSAPSIPLASQIVDHCKARYADLCAQTPTLPPASPPVRGAPLEDYSYWFELAYRQPRARAEYLSSIIKGKPISAATFRLAHLLSERAVASFVVTTNFDDHLAQALTLLGQSPIVCDHPSTTARIDVDRSSDIQIVHIHGTHWFYDCCNLKAELMERGRWQDKEAPSMFLLLNRVLSNRSPIVVGYSGWEQDVFMSTLKKRLAERVPYNVYWFLHRREDMKTLPDWLRTNEYVRVIAPTLPLHSGIGSDEDTPEESDLDRDGESDLDNGDSRQYTLSAREVFDTFNQIIHLDPPSLTKDPLRFFARRLRELSGASTPLGEDQHEPDAADFYDFADVIRRVEHAADVLEVQDSDTQRTLEEVRNALRQSRYEEALILAIVNYDSIVREADAPDLRQLSQMLLLAAKEIARGSKLFSDCWDIVNRYLEVLVAKTDQLSDRVLLARAKLYKAHRYNPARRDQAMSLCGEILREFGKDSESKEIAYVLADAHYGLGYFYSTENKRHQAITEYEESIEIAAALEARGAQSMLISVSRSLARLYADGGDLGKAVEVLDRLDDLVPIIDSHELKHKKALSLRDKADYLVRVSKYDSAVQTCDALATSFGGDPDAWVRGTVLGANLQRGKALEGLGDLTNAGMAYDLILDADKEQKGLSSTYVANALEQRILILLKEGLVTEARQLYDRIHGRLGESKLPVIKSHLEAAAKAILNAGGTQTPNGG